MNTGTTPRRSENGLVTTIAWGYRGEICYALEGSVFVAGSAIQWLRDQMKFFKKSSESQQMAQSVKNDSGVIMVPAFVGLGAPYWDDKCRGALFGITRGTTPEDITKATLESLAYQTKDVISAMEQDCSTSIEKLKVDGGAAMNDYLMQFQSDILQCDVTRPASVETTALGAAHLAGLAVGFWKDTDELETSDEGSKTYEPVMDKEKSDHLYDRWKLAVSAARMFPTE